MTENAEEKSSEVPNKIAKEPSFFGRFVLRRINEKGWSYAQLCKRIADLFGKSLGRGAISHLKTGETQEPEFHNGLLILLALGVDPNDYAREAEYLPEVDPKNFSVLLYEAWTQEGRPKLSPFEVSEIEERIAEAKIHSVTAAIEIFRDVRRSAPARFAYIIRETSSQFKEDCLRICRYMKSEWRAETSEETEKESEEERGYGPAPET